MSQEGPVEDLKLVLIAGIATRIRKGFESQTQAAQHLGYDQGVISRLCNGRHDRFSLDWLVNTADKLGATLSVKVD